MVSSLDWAEHDVHIVPRPYLQLWINHPLLITEVLTDLSWGNRQYAGDVVARSAAGEAGTGPGTALQGTVRPQMA
jgi:hypothetical protein